MQVTSLDPAGVTKEQAQRRVDRIAAFRDELATLEQAGVVALSAEQKAVVERYHASTLEQLSRHFDVDRSDVQKQMSLAMRIASLVGAVTLSAAVFLFFYRFWGMLSAPVQVLLLATAPLAAALGVDVAARREKTLYFASLMSVVAFACFVLDLNVLGAIFNMKPTPGAMLAWGLFALALAYGYGLRLMLVTGLVLLGGYGAALLAHLSGIEWTDFAMRPEAFVLAGGCIFALAGAGFNGARTGFPLLFRSVGVAAVLLPLLLLATEIGPDLSYLHLPRLLHRGLYDLAGFGLGALAVVIGIRRGWGEVTNVGSAFFVLFLYVKLFDWFWDSMPRYLFFLVLGLVAVGALFLLKRVRARTSEV